MKYRVLTEWLMLAKTYGPGEVVELPEHEAAPFIGSALEPVEPPAEEPTKPTKKKAANQ